MTMDDFINKFLYWLHYVPYIKDEKVKIQQLLGCIPPNFRERIELDMPKTLDTTLHKARICYEHRELRQENINRSRDRSMTFSNNRKLGFNPPPYRKQNKSFPVNKEFNKIDANPNVPAPNTNKLVANGGTNVSPLPIKCWKFQGPHYARNCKNKANGVVHNLQEDPTVEDIARRPRIYTYLDG